jgi:hypothetical protein
MPATLLQPGGATSKTRPRPEAASTSTTSPPERRAAWRKILQHTTRHRHQARADPGRRVQWTRWHPFAPRLPPVLESVPSKDRNRQSRMPTSLSRRAGAAIAGWLGLFGAGVALAATPSPFQSVLPRDPVQEAQISAIVARMTLARKGGQLPQPDIRAVTPAGVTGYYIGSALDGGGAWAGMNKHASEADWLALADTWWETST